MAASGAYDVLVQVHDFPYKSMQAEVETADEVTRALLAATRDRPDLLPVYVSLTSGEPPPEIKAVLDHEGGGAPLLRGAREAFHAIGSVTRWQRRHEARRSAAPWRADWPALARDRSAFGLDPAAEAPTRPSPRSLGERDSLELLRHAGLAITPAIAVRDAEAAVEAARPLGGHAVVLKIDAPALAHKSDLGLVRLDVRGDEAVRAAAVALLDAARRDGIDARGLLVQPMAEPGVELIVGARRDASFGPLVIVGLGGVLAEVVDDVAIRLAPLSRDAALEMLGELRGARLLDGVRGQPSIDRDAIADLIVGVAAFAADRQDILEIDLNPVIATADGAVAVDALVVVDERG
jgi:acyl-CoA synthetase (NDP forming)